jgi:molybdenum cofactor biosynthesis enzyme MoaA
LALKISQREHQESEGFQILLQEIQSFSQVKNTYISGGEPFLYNNLPDLLNTLDNFSDKTVCYTGLGVDPKRFSAQLSKIKNKNKLTIIVSGETCGSLYEFNRHGNSWDNFVVNINELQKQGFDYEFSLVISNLTIFGIIDFVETFPDKKLQYQFCAVPDFLSVNVLDDTSKQTLIEKLQQSNLPFKDEVCHTMSQSCTTQQRNDLSIYVKEFARRRNLDLSIFPESFYFWIKG